MIPGADIEASAAALLLAAVTYPEELELLDGTKERTLDVALAIANATVPPPWMRQDAGLRTSVSRLANAVQAGCVDLREMARDAVDLTDRYVRDARLADPSVRDADGEELEFTPVTEVATCAWMACNFERRRQAGMEPQEALDSLGECGGFSESDAAMVIALAALVHVARGKPESAPEAS